MRSPGVVFVVLCGLSACHAFQAPVLHRAAANGPLCLRASSQPAGDRSNSAKTEPVSVQPGLLNRRALIQAAVALPFLAGSSVNAEGLFDGGGQIGWGEAQKA